MIDSIIGSKSIMVTGGGSTVPYGLNSDQSYALRYTKTGFQFNVDNYWQPLPMAVTMVSLHYDAEQAIAWAHARMIEEETLNNLANINPSVKIAADNLRKAQEQLKTTILLSKEYDK